ncbi:hypothetical protein ACPB9E_17405 [Streptomyces exfoliatus]|uniref:hypothetical protein n=1 Tax=Streptomyces exfoliatus TaxID=1905 RepID=UPI003C2EA4D4
MGADVDVGAVEAARWIGADPVVLGAGAAARGAGEPMEPEAGDAAAGAAVSRLAAARGMGAPIGDRRGARLGCGAGASAAERRTGAPSPGCAGGTAAEGRG